ncbi:FecR family protein [Telluribacter sp.]|jgi:ferric-dicitrate binding protein FerR (iron transport regulator)|uniref:FecR family protein n=1 Tax=Telluribacter sp. TaxID=1978767 RepID=UPI002E10D120|nr:FecR domain-containing protein [Telluribacter sp.]
MERNPLPADLLKRYLADECSEQERRKVDEWYRSLDQQTEVTPYSFSADALQQRIRSRIREEEDNRAPALIRPLRRWWAVASGAAAAVLVALGFLYLLSQKVSRSGSVPTLVEQNEAWVDYRNDQKKVVRYSLPDRSVVWLHPGARVSHPPAFAAARREVRFVGEGFFDVVRDTLHPFVIYSGQLQTQVLGTSFNVKAYENDPTYHVSVVTGSVAVRSTAPAAHQTEPLVLKPNQQATFTSHTSRLTLSTIAEKEFKKEAWQPVSLTFDDTPLTEVVARLQKTFKVKIELTNVQLSRCRLKVDFNNQRLPEILEMINTLLGTTYEMEGETIFLSGEGCAS